MAQAISKKETTAVEWLVKELTNLGYIYAPSFGHAIIDNKIEQAKAMEKEQIEMAFSKSYLIGLAEVNYDDVNKAAEQYYNETYAK